ncbi:MAG TPA: hypothetical protein VEK08_25400 [Planctomycetota bacterium]|nr:hypothetical protein [Planctomycetota bacterium]
MPRPLAQFLIVLVLVSLLSSHALAMKPFLDRARKVYDLEGKLAKCTLCHDVDESKKEEPKGNNLDDYGMDFENHPLMKPLLHVDENYKYSKAELKTFEQVMKLLEGVDSDKDGATNLEELQLGTLPGRKDSVPSAEALAKLRGKKR